MLKQLANVHDAFFKQVLSDPKLAGTFLREHLPPEVAAVLGPELPTLMPGSYVDEGLRQHHSDLLFQVRLKDGRDAFAYVLTEHKSSPDPGARLQLLRYVVRVLTRLYDRNNRQLPLPPVIPLLAHQGPEGWNISCEFMDLFGVVPAALRPYLPSFSHALVDLAPIDDEALSAEANLRAFLKVLKYSRRRDLPDRIDFVLAEAPVLQDADLLVVLTYLDKLPRAINSSVVHEALERLVPDRKGKMMGWLTQPYYDKGLAEGEAKILTRLLERRFGVIPAAIRQRILAAEAGCIEAWVERVFDAPDLQSVFESN